MRILGTRLAARRLGVSERRVRALIIAGSLPATKIGHDWAIAENDLARVAAVHRKPGRPAKKAR